MNRYPRVSIRRTAIDVTGHESMIADMDRRTVHRPGGTGNPDRSNMMAKLTKAAARRQASAEVLKAFKDSGEEFTCIASVFTVRPVAIAQAKKLLSQGINLSKSNYPFAHVGLMADMFLMDAAKELCS